MPAGEESDDWANAHWEALTLFEPELNDKPRGLARRQAGGSHVSATAKG